MAMYNGKKILAVYYNGKRMFSKVNFTPRHYETLSRLNNITLSQLSDKKLSEL